MCLFGGIANRGTTRKLVTPPRQIFHSINILIGGDTAFSDEISVSFYINSTYWIYEVVGEITEITKNTTNEFLSSM